MRLDTAYYDDSAGEYAALAQETTFLRCTVTQQFNGSATAVIELGDKDGSIAQKYDNDATAHTIYVGPGRARIQYPTGTTIYDGRIVKARHDQFTNRLFLYCRDWLDQLDDERINYDMREDLDGAGLRESTLNAVSTDVHCLAGTNVYGRMPVVKETFDSTTYHFLYDADMAWTEDQFNGMYLVFPIKVLGTQTFNALPYFSFTTDSPTETGTPSNVYADDDTYFVLTQAGGGGGVTFTYSFWFHIDLADGDMLSSGPTRANIILKARCQDLSADASVQIYDNATSSLLEQGTLTNRAGDTAYYYYSIPIDEDLLAHIIDASEIIKMTISGDAPAGTNGIIGLDYVAVELTYETVAATNTSKAIGITDTLPAWEKVDAVQNYDNSGTSYNDITTAGITDGYGGNEACVCFPTNPIANLDAFLVGFDAKVNAMLLYMGTAGNWVGTVAWYYSEGGGSWHSVSGFSPITSSIQQLEFAGTEIFTWSSASWTSWATDTLNGLGPYYWVKCAANSPSGTTTLPNLMCAYKRSGSVNMLHVDTDCSKSGLGVWQDMPYSIIQPIYKHIDSAESGTLITDGDALSSKTNGAGAISCAATIEHTSGLTSRHYIEKTRLEILQDLVNMDKAVFWMTLGGTTLNYKSTFNDGSPTALTDADVLSWTEGEYDADPMRNEYHLYGVRVGDNQVYFDTNDGTDPGSDSKSLYGYTHSDVYTGGGLMHQRDAEALGDILVERDEDIHLFLSAEIAGISSLRLGDEVSITSSYLGLTAATYIVSHWKFDSSAYRTYVRFHPRVSQLGLVRHDIGIEGYFSTKRENDALRAETYRPDLTGQAW